MGQYHLQNFRFGKKTKQAANHLSIRRQTWKRAMLSVCVCVPSTRSALQTLTLHGAHAAT